MTSEEDKPESTKTPNAIVRPLAYWIFGGLLAVVVLSLTMAFAPVSLKRLGLFFAVFGAAVGMVLNWLAGELRLNRDRRLDVLCGTLTLLGMLNLTYASYQQFHNAREQWAKEHPGDVAAINALEKMTQADPELAEQYKRERSEYDPRFVDYLTHRTSALGEMPVSGAVAIWLGEIAVAIAASVWMFRLPARKFVESLEKTNAE
ncbi:MAG: hypothetical protein KDA80_09725 [Planctomycetaceae bacterium]|nr:hypothetical protein [Planctomycetaceae bacterium]